MDTGDTAWVLTCAALVLLMTPGLALFYGGMVRSKSVLNMMMMSFSAMAVVGVLWVLYGYSVAFGNDVGSGLLGSPGEFLGLKGLLGTSGIDDGFQATSLVFTIPSMAFVAFQAVFAIITVALISGSIADRARFGPWLLFAAIWATFVYFPVAHWVFAFDAAESEIGGWIANDLLAIDFAVEDLTRRAEPTEAAHNRGAFQKGKSAASVRRLRSEMNPRQRTVSRS